MKTLTKAIITIVTLGVSYKAGQLIEAEERKVGTDDTIIMAECVMTGMIIGSIGRKIIKSI